MYHDTRKLKNGNKFVAPQHNDGGLAMMMCHASSSSNTFFVAISLYNLGNSHSP